MCFLADHGMLAAYSDNKFIAWFHMWIALKKIKIFPADKDAKICPVSSFCGFISFMKQNRGVTRVLHELEDFCCALISFMKRNDSLPHIPPDVLFFNMKRGWTA